MNLNGGDIIEYAQTVYTLWDDGTISIDEAHSWFKEANCKLIHFTDNKIQFSFDEEWYTTKVTITNAGITFESNV